MSLLGLAHEVVVDAPDGLAAGQCQDVGEQPAIVPQRRQRLLVQRLVLPRINRNDVILPPGGGGALEDNGRRWWRGRLGLVGQVRLKMHHHWYPLRSVGIARVMGYVACFSLRRYDLA